MRQQRYSARVDIDLSGRIASDTDRQSLSTILRNFSGKTVDISVQRAQNKRSLEQNGYYFKCIVPALQRAVFDMWGEDVSKEEAHAMLRDRFSFIERCHVATGEPVRIPVSTSKNGTMDQEDYHEKCRRWIFDVFGVVVPLPNEGIETEDAEQNS